MATTLGTAEFSSAKAEIVQVLEDYGNTITITPQSSSTDTNEWGEFEKTAGTPFTTSSVTYDTESVRKDFGNSVVLNDGESLMLVKPDVVVGEEDIITIRGIDYKLVSMSYLTAADVDIAQLLVVGVLN